MQKTNRVVQDHLVIEIDSSPEPAPRSRPVRSTRLSSKTPSTSTQSSVKGKGKEKEKPVRKPAKVALGPVIELTDSEPDVVMETGPSQAVKRTHSYSNTLQAKPVGASTSSENIPIASGSGSSKKRKHTAPLFLPSDEENEPPFVVVEENERNPKKVQRGKGKERENVNVDSNGDEKDWDPEFVKKPFPFQYLDGDPFRVVLGPEPAPAPAPSVPDPQPVQPVPAPAPIAQPAPVAQPPPAGPVPEPAAPARLHEEPAAMPVPVPEPEPEVDPASRAVAQVLEIIPDVEPEYLLGLVQTHLPNFGQQTAEHILGLFFEDGGYPRVDVKKKGKRKSDVVLEGGGGDGEGGDEDKPNKKVKVDYASPERPFTGGQEYTELALVQLQTSFPFLPKPYLRQSLQRHKGLYAPTHLALAAAERSYVEGPLHTRLARPYVLKSTRYNPSKDRKRVKDVVNEAFAEERRWLVEHLQDPNETDAMTVGAAAVAVGQEDTGKGKEKAVEGAVDDDEPLEEGTGIECQCCFAEYAFDKMVQCAEAHLFCRDCVSQYASTKLGEHNHLINCMHESGCKEPFPISELRRILSPKLMDLYERVKQQKEIEAAGLEGLEECPFCEWKCVLEVSNEEDKLFRCGNEEGGCGVVSCRMCKKKEHLPKTCQEAEEDKHLNGRHAIEEAMTRALMRNCPKCKKAFVKDAGCNKMTCPNCHTLSCYVCRKVITGYDHFDQTPAGRPSGSKSSGKCLLWDQVEERHAAEVKAAAEKAMEDYRRAHPEVEDKDIKVDIPIAPPPPAPPAPLHLPVVAPAAQAWHFQVPPINVHGAWGGVNAPVNYLGIGQPYQMPHVQQIAHHPPLPPAPARPVALRQTRARQAAERLEQQRRLQQQRVREQEDQQRRLQQQQWEQRVREHEQQQAQLRQRDEQYRQLLRQRQEHEGEVARANARHQEALAADARRVQHDLRARVRQQQQEVQQRVQQERQRFQEALRRHEVAPPLAVPQAPAAGRKRARR